MRILIFGQKDMLSFSKVMHLAHCITFAIGGQNVFVGNIIDVHLFYDFSKIHQKMCLKYYSNLVKYLLLSYLEYPQYLPPRCLSARVVAQKIVRPT
jgi:hypothetical protein